MEDQPKLRPVEPIPVNIKGDTMIALRDPLELSDKSVLLSPHMYIVLTMLDGTNSIKDIQEKFHHLTGVMLEEDYLNQLFAQLDESLLLDTPRFRKVFSQFQDEYRQLPTRKANHIGMAYPEDPQELKDLLDGYLQATASDTPPHENLPRAVIAPHIDFERGQTCYGLAYNTLKSLHQEVTFIIFGTAHAAMNGLVSVTRKDFETPLGLVKSDQEFIDHLEQSSPIGLGSDELIHRNEHSIEFQAIFLQHLFGEQTPFYIVPILVGSFARFVEDERAPMEDEAFAGFVSALKDTISKSNRPVCLLGAVDLAHMGPRFGQETNMNGWRSEELRARDLATLQLITAGDATGFFDEIAREKDDRNICGFPPIYTLLSTLGTQTGSLIKYEQTIDESGSCVSFCSVLFPQE